MMDDLLRKSSMVVTAVVAGVTAGYLAAHLYQKKKEKDIGGRLMRVNYRFTKEFDD